MTKKTSKSRNNNFVSTKKGKKKDKRHNGSITGHTGHAYAATRALELIKPYMDGKAKPSSGNHSKKRHVTMGDDLVQVVRDSYYVFLTKGLVCTRCGAKATIAKLEGSPHTNRKHFEFYTASGVRMTADHVIPRALGGSNNPENIQPMCEKCNCEKAAFIPRTEHLSFNMLSNPSELQQRLLDWKLERVFEQLFPDFNESEWIREHLDGELEPKPKD